MSRTTRGLLSRNTRRVARLVSVGHRQLRAEMRQTDMRGLWRAGVTLTIGGIALVISSILQCSNIEGSAGGSSHRLDQLNFIHDQIVLVGRNFAFVAGPAPRETTTIEDTLVAKAGVFYYGRGPKDSTIITLREAVRLDSTNAYARLFLGLALADSAYAAAKLGHREPFFRLNDEAERAYADARRFEARLDVGQRLRLGELQGLNRWNRIIWETRYSDVDSNFRLKTVVWVQLAWGAAQALFGLLLVMRWPLTRRRLRP